MKLCFISITDFQAGLNVDCLLNICSINLYQVDKTSECSVHFSPEMSTIDKLCFISITDFQAGLNVDCLLNICSINLYQVDKTSECSVHFSPEMSTIDK